MRDGTGEGTGRFFVPDEGRGLVWRRDGERLAHSPDFSGAATIGGIVYDVALWLKSETLIGLGFRPHRFGPGDKR